GGIVGGKARGENFAVAIDDRKQVVEIVGHAPGQAPDRIEPLGVDQRLLQTALVRHVAIGADHVGGAAARVKDGTEIPGGIDRGAGFAGKVAFTGKHAAGLELPKPGTQADEKGGVVGVKKAVAAAGHLGRGVTGHLTETVVDEKNGQAAGAKLRSGKENAVAE